MRVLLAATLVLALASGCDKPNVERAAEIERAQLRWDGHTQRFLSGDHPLDLIAQWTFAGASHGVQPINAVVTPTPDGLRVVATGEDPGLRTPAGLQLRGEDADIVLVRVTRLAAAASWDGSLYYATGRLGEAAERRAVPQPVTSPPIGVQTVLIYDMKQPSVGRAWRRSAIDQIRLDLDNEAGGAFLIHEIAIAHR